MDDRVKEDGDVDGFAQFAIGESQRAVGGGEIDSRDGAVRVGGGGGGKVDGDGAGMAVGAEDGDGGDGAIGSADDVIGLGEEELARVGDRKSTRLNSSHLGIS